MGEMSSRIVQRDFAKRFERGELSRRRPDVRTRTARILPDDWAIAASRTRPWLASGCGCRVGFFPERVEVDLWLLPVCRRGLSRWRGGRYGVGEPRDFWNRSEERRVGKE